MNWGHTYIQVCERESLKFQNANVKCIRWPLATNEVGSTELDDRDRSEDPETVF